MYTKIRSRILFQIYNIRIVFVREKFCKLKYTTCYIKYIYYAIYTKNYSLNLLILRLQMTFQLISELSKSQANRLKS